MCGSRAPRVCACTAAAAGCCPRQGYRVYLRRRYEAPPLPGLIFDAPHAHPVRGLMVHNDVRMRRDRVRWHL